MGGTYMGFRAAMSAVLSASSGGLNGSSLRAGGSELPLPRSRPGSLAMEVRLKLEVGN